jgi:eukaryotic-like serine/threonine-protein kinase
MICAHCRRETSPGKGVCTNCGRPVDVPTVQVAAGVLTPVPSSTADGLTIAPNSDLGEYPNTRLPSAEVPDDLATRFGDDSALEAGGHGPLVPGTTLGPRYHIIRLLGIGGMGAVYQAWDSELGVTVALKVIRPESTSEGAVGRLERRFKQELLLARQVTHKNVVRIHDLGEINGIKYITMPYIEGADLASVLRTSGTMPVPDCLRIARDVVAGLQAAHEAGVVHRDLKPANIMIDGDQAVIMDFGIARSTSPAGAVKAAGLSGASASASGGSARFTKPRALEGSTMAGAVLGTLEYMAPEQARGEAVDQRADIYAFGLIVYDMLLGGRHHTGALSAFDELTQRMQQAPPSPRTVNPQIPEALDEVVAKCVRPDAAERYQTTAELAAAFDRLDADGNLLPEPRRFTRWQLMAASVLLVAIVTGTWWLSRSPAPAAEHPLVSVLISDFDNRTGDTSFEGSLEQALGLAVEGASFVTTYRRDEARKAVARLRPGGKLDEDGAKLISVREGIHVILAGDIGTRGDGYLLNVRAIDAATGKILTEASAAARTKADVLKTVGTIASKVRTTLGDTTPESARLTAAETVTTASLDALADYSRAQDFLYNSKDEDAIVYYKRAIERDPNLGRAYSGWAISAENLGRNEEAAEAWKKTLSLLDRMTERERYRTLGNYYVHGPRNYEKAIESFRKLVELYPHDRGGRVNLALAYFYTRDFANALAEGRRSVEDAPRDVMNRANLALYAMYAGDFPTAAAEANTVLEQDAAVYRAYLPIAMAAIAQSDFEGARRSYESMARSGPPGASLANLGLADLALYQGRFRDAAALLTDGIREDEQRKSTGRLAAKYTALAEAYLGDNKTAPAVAAAQRVMTLAGQTTAAVPAARVLIAAGQPNAARELAASLTEQLQPESRAYAKVLEGEIALRDGKKVTASEAFLAAQKLVDVWWARLDLGIAYVEAEHYAEALGELERCQQRRGETTAILMDDLPSIRYLAPVPYWTARAQEPLGQRAAAEENYKTYLAIRPNAPSDRLAADARRRLGAP